MIGQVILQPKQAELYINVENEPKLDPYIEFQVGDQHERTHESKDGHKMPFWNDVITLQTHGEEMMYFKVMDDRFFKDKFIGEGHISLMEAMKSGHMMNWFPIYDKGKNIGKLLLDMTTQVTGVKSQQGMGMGMGMGMGTMGMGMGQQSGMPSEQQMGMGQQSGMSSGQQMEMH